jgi:CBS domain-containing protein
MITVNEIMSTDLQTLHESDTVHDARKLMTERHIRHIPILDQDGILKGLVTQRDILAATLSKIEDASNEERLSFELSVPLKEIMTQNISVIDRHANIRKAALRLQSHKHGCLPVVADGKLIGIVTDTDFIAVAINLLEQLEMAEPEEVE